ncbi:MAG: hypothetical protein LRY51_18260 [Geovibrio sp.]|nr:hypothetical protein [Geovibrio sp.]
MYFSELKPDFSVIETGMGGRFDSSNVLNVKLLSSLPLPRITPLFWETVFTA